MPPRVFRDLIWPAVAGNILWTIVTLATRPEGCWVVVRQLTLVALGIYAVADWVLQIRGKWTPVRPRVHCVFEALFSAGIAALAMSTYFDTSAAPYLLIFVLLVAAVGHLCHAWGKDKDTTSLAVLDFLGAAIVGISVGVTLEEKTQRWWRFGAIAFVLPFWMAYRFYEDRKAKPGGGGAAPAAP